MNILPALLVLVVGQYAMHTDNFIVDAPDRELAQSLADKAEVYRREIAVRWTGGTLPRWRSPCLVVASYADRPWGMTYHTRGLIRGISMRGTREEILTHSLPHEISHAVVMSKLGERVPLWAGEGMAVSSELDCPARLGGRCGTLPLGELFEVRRYPEDWAPFYGQSYSVTTYIFETYGQAAFLGFLRCGIKEGWDYACEQCLETTIDGLDEGWRRWHKATSPEGHACLPMWRYG